jgi:hypothetical protein
LQAQGTGISLKFNKKLNFHSDFDSDLSISASFQNRIAIAGQLFPETQEPYSVFLIFDTIGNLISANSLSRIGKIKIQSMEFDHSGNLYIAGVAYDLFEESGFLVKWNENNGVIWSGRIDHPEESNTKSVVIKNESIFLIGNLKNPNNDAFIVILNQNGVISESVRIKNTFDIQTAGFAEPHDIAIAGFDASNQLQILITDTNLTNIERAGMNLSASPDSRVSDIIKSSSGNWVISGYSDLLNSPAYESFILDWHADSTAAGLTTIKNTNDVRILDLVRHPLTGEIKAFGSAEFYGNGIDNGLLVSLDSYLNPEHFIIAGQEYGSKIFGAQYLSNDARFLFGNRNDNGLKDGINTVLMREDDWQFCGYDTFSLSHVYQRVIANKTQDSFSAFSPAILNTMAMSDSVNTIESIICIEGHCSTLKPEIIYPDSFCIGDDLLFRSNHSYPTNTWSVNGSVLSRDSTMQLPYKGDSLEIILYVEDSLGCRSQDRVFIAPTFSDVKISGPNQICTNSPNACYQLSDIGPAELQFEAFNGDILSQSGDSICCRWKYGNGSMRIFSTDSAGCRFAVSELSVRTDSGNTGKPDLYLAGIDTTTGSSRLYFDLPDYKSGSAETFQLKKKTGEFWETITLLLEEEKQWISPQQHDFNSYKITGLNNCGIEMESSAHRPVELRFEIMLLR